MELTTIAKPYANAIFQIAQQDNLYADWKSFLEAGTHIANDANMTAFIASPKVAKIDKSKTLIQVFQSALDKVLNAEEIALIGLLLENNRINTLPSILQLFDLMHNLSSDSKVFQIISAYKLSIKEEEQMVDYLSNKHNAKISITTEIDENLIGGVVIKEGDKVIDLSIQARMVALGSNLSVAC